MKKVFVSMLAVMVALSLVLSGCGGSTGETKQESTPSQDSQAAGTSEGPKELSFSVYHTTFGDPNDPVRNTPVGKKWQEMMEAYMGMKLNISWTEVPWQEFLAKLMVYLASNDLADVVQLMHESDNLAQLGQLGGNKMIVNLLDYENNLTYFSKFLDEGNNRKMMTAADGNIYAFGEGGISENTGSYWTWGYRYDIFEKEGIPIPTTLDEIYTAAKALKAKYPQAYPINSIATSDRWYNIQRVFLLANNTDTDLYWNGEKFVLAPVHDADRYKATLEYLNKLYVEKLLDPEFFTATGEQIKQWCLDGRTFIGPNAYNANTDLNLLENFGGQWVAGPYPQNANGKVAWKFGSNRKGISLSTWSGISISAKTEHPDLLVKLVDYQYSPEIIELSNWGIEGTTYTKDAEGKKVYTDLIKQNKNADGAIDPGAKLKEFGIQTSSSARPGIQFVAQDKAAWVGNGSYDKECFVDGKVQIMNMYEYSEMTGGEASIPPADFTPAVKLTKEQEENKAVVMTAINTYIDECLVKFITGKMKLSEYDKFLEQLKKLGDYEAVLDAMNQNIVK